MFNLPKHWIEVDPDQLKSLQEIKPVLFCDLVTLTWGQATALKWEKAMLPVLHGRYQISESTGLCALFNVKATQGS